MKISLLTSLGVFTILNSWAVTTGGGSKKSEPAASALQLEIEGEVYPKEAFPESCKILFKGGKCEVSPYGKFHIESMKENDELHSTSIFSGPEGVQVNEQSWSKDGHVRKAIIENKALQKISKLEVKEGVAYFEVTDTRDGSVKTAHEKAETNLVVPSTVIAYVQPYLPVLLKGEVVKLSVAVLDRKEIFSFNMKRERVDQGLQGEEILVLKMEPGNFLVKALVDPLYFYLKTKTGEVFAFEGRSSLRKKEGDRFRDMDVKSAYHYKVNAMNGALKAGVPAQNCSEEMLKSNQFDKMKCEVKGEPL